MLVLALALSLWYIVVVTSPSSVHEATYATYLPISHDHFFISYLSVFLWNDGMMGSGSGKGM